MKKYLLILAACTLFVSCQWYYENVASTKDCTEWYLDEMYEAAKDGDVEEFRETMFDFYEWIESMDEVEQKEGGDAFRSWRKNNEFKEGVLDDFQKKHKDELPNF